MTLLLNTHVRVTPLLRSPHIQRQQSQLALKGWNGVFSNVLHSINCNAKQGRWRHTLATSRRLIQTWFSFLHVSLVVLSSKAQLHSLSFRCIPEHNQDPGCNGAMGQSRLTSMDFSVTLPTLLSKCALRGLVTSFYNHTPEEINQLVNSVREPKPPPPMPNLSLPSPFIGKSSFSSFIWSPQSS